MAPGEDYRAAAERVAQHLRDVAPWGVRASVTVENEPGKGYMVDTASPVFAAARAALREAFDHDVLEMGSGGSIPLVPVLVETFPGIEVLIWGAADHLSNYHSRNESVDLGEVVRMAQAEALFLQRWARARERTGARLDAMSDEQPQTTAADVVQALPVRRAPAATEPSEEAITQPAKLLRIASMVRELLEQTRQTTLDEPGRKRLADIYGRAVGELSEVLSPDLREELGALAPPLEDVPTEAELRVAQAQLVGWLEGLFHGIQAAMFAQQAAARRSSRSCSAAACWRRTAARPRGRATAGPTSGQYL